MSDFKLFKFLSVKIPKNNSIALSRDREFYSTNSYYFSNYPSLKHFMIIPDGLSLFKSIIILKSIMNFEEMKKRTSICYLVNFPQENRREEITKNLPYMVDSSGKKRYVLFLSEEMEEKIYANYFEDEVGEGDYGNQFIDPFRIFGNRPFTSFLSPLIVLYKEEFTNTIAFYHIDSESIYVIDDQACLEAFIPLFDKFSPEVSKTHIIAKLIELMKAYFNNDKDTFISLLGKDHLISTSLYEKVLLGEYDKL